mgnify:CR=1 FL=1
MKIGFRTPSLKKSLKARTTGRLKRQMKKAINPLYGKKGMGLINNPKKAVCNKIYNKTTVDALAGIKKASKNGPTTNITETEEAEYAVYRVNYTGNKWIYIFLAIFLGIFGIQFFYIGEKSKGIKCLLFFWTGIPYIYSLYMALVALFKPVNQKGEIEFQSEQRIMRIS